MADLASVVATSLRNYGTTLHDQVFDAHPGFWWLRDNGQVKAYDGGLSVNEDIQIGKNTSVGARDPKAKIPIIEQDPLRQVMWHDVAITGGLPIFWADERKNAQRIADYAKSLIKNLQDTMTDELGSQFYENGTDPDGEPCLQGLESIIAFSNTYGTLVLDEAFMALTRTAAAQTAYPWWMPANRAGTNDYSSVTNRFETAEPLSLNAGADGGLQNLYDRCRRGKTREEPNLILMGTSLFQKLKALLLPTKTYRDEKTFNAGFPSNLLFDNAVVIMDANLDALLGDRTYCLNTKHIYLRPDSVCAKKVLIEERAPVSDQFVKTFLSVWKGQMTCVAPRYQGKMSNKTV